MSANEGIELPLSLDTRGLGQSLGVMDALLKALNKINASVSAVDGNLRGAGSQMSREFKTAEKGADSLIDKLGKIGLAIQGVKGIAQSVMGSLAPIFEEGLGRDATVASLKTLMKGDLKAAQMFAKELRNEDMAKLYGSGTITDAAKTMMSFGIDKNKTKDMLSAISDIAGGNTQSFNSLVLAFSQATSLGKLQGQDKLQMIGAGFNPLVQIAQDLGKSVKEVDEMMGKGQISADMLADAFRNATKEGGTYFGATKEQMGGLNGMLKTFQSTTGDLFDSLYQAIKPVAESVMPSVIAIVQEAITLVPQLTTVVQALAVSVGTLATIYGVYWSWQKLVYVWTNRQILATKVLGAVQKITFGYWIAIFTMIASLINSVVKHWDYLKKSFTDGGILHGLMAVGKVILDAILTPVQHLLDLLSNIPGLGKLAGKGAGYIAELRKNLFGESGIVPGESGDSTMGGPTKGGTMSTPSALASGTSAVATGGTRNTSITISMGSLVHQITYNGGIKENTRETTQDLQEALLRVLNAAANTAG